MRFREKVAIVTGAAGGIGLATARRLGSEGARVVIADLKGDAAERSAGEVRQAGAPDALGMACDVLGDTGRSHRGSGNGPLRSPRRRGEQRRPDDLQVPRGADPAGLAEVLNVDLFGAVHFTRQAFLTMKPGSAIVNVASIHAVMTEPLVAPYAAAKAAVLSLTRSAAIEGKAKGIRANVVLPGAIDTPMLWDNPNVKSGAEKVDRSMVGKPEDIAAAITFLASDDAGFVTGTALRVDGGRLDRL